MKVLVLANCPYLAYANYLKATHPDWDVRAVVLSQADTWLQEKNAKFLEFVDEIDVFVGLTNHASIQSRIKASVTRVFLPPFEFSGFHPDTLWLHGVPSSMNAGVIHSRIATSAYLSGLTVAQAKSLFNLQHYRELGYLDVYASEKLRLLQSFAGYGFDITELFETWAHNGNFLHTPNHPDIRVLFDIVHLGMEKAGLAANISASALANLRETADDYLGAGCIWPIYPEIAAHFGVAAKPSRWRTSVAKGLGVEFDLQDMLDKSWSIFENVPERRDSMIKMLGGPEKVAQYAGL